MPSATGSVRSHHGVVQVQYEFGRASQARSLVLRGNYRLMRLVGVRPEYSDVRLWHLADINDGSEDVRFRG